MTERGAGTDQFTSAKEIPNPVAEIIDYHISLLQEEDPGILYDKLFTITDSISNIDSRLIGTAINIASLAHLAQTRIFTKQKYILHPLRVALLAIRLAQAMGEPVTDELIAGAILHDTSEDSPPGLKGNPDLLYTQQTLEKNFRLFGRRKAKAIAADSEAFNHNTVKENGVVNNERYFDKIKTRDKQVFTRRQIIKAADRIDNLLDPPVLPSGAHNRMDEIAVKFRRSRLSYVKENHNPKGIMNLLLTRGSLLDNVVQTAGDISRQTMRHIDFDPPNWRQYLPITIFQR